MIEPFEVAHLRFRACMVGVLRAVALQIDAADLVGADVAVDGQLMPFRRAPNRSHDGVTFYELGPEYLGSRCRLRAESEIFVRARVRFTRDLLRAIAFVTLPDENGKAREMPITDEAHDGEVGPMCWIAMCPKCKIPWPVWAGIDRINSDDHMRTFLPHPRIAGKSERDVETGRHFKDYLRALAPSVEQPCNALDPLIPCEGSGTTPDGPVVLNGCHPYPWETTPS